MPPLVRRDIWYDASDGRSRIKGYVFTNPYIRPYCILQISHGMCEHMERYEDFAGYLAAQGVAVCGNDHIGHGASVAQPEDYGYFGGENGRLHALNDLKTMNDKAHELFPRLPLVLLGHSMGSFFARRYVVKWPATVNGLILSGTGGPNGAAGLGILVANLLATLRGDRYRSDFMYRLVFGSYLKRLPNPNTIYDWISRDEDIVAQYAADERCTFRFTLDGFRELFGALRDVTGPKWAATLRKNMPLLMIQGAEDPVGDYAAGTDKVRKWLREAGVRHLEYKTYPGARHEVLNETNRQQVYADVNDFLKRWWGGKAAPGE